MSLQRMILLAVLVGAACSDNGDEGGQGPGDEAPEADVRVENNRFDPAALQVTPGATVVWGWASGGVEHNVTFEDGVASGTQGSGTFERTFESAGDYPYVCTIHAPGMSGVVNVGSAPAPDDDGGPYDY